MDSLTARPTFVKALSSLTESGKMDSMAKKARLMPFPIRLAPALRKRLEVLAAADHRNLSNYILTVLERHADAAEKPRESEKQRRS